jgi:natural product precursor
MKKTFKNSQKIRIAGTEQLSKKQMKHILGGSFPCYCNGNYVGQFNEILACFNAC